MKEGECGCAYMKESVGLRIGRRGWNGVYEGEWGVRV